MYIYFILMSLFIIKKLSQIGENTNLKSRSLKALDEQQKRKKEICLLSITNLLNKEIQLDVFTKMLMHKKMKTTHDTNLSYGDGKKMTKPYIHNESTFLFKFGIMHAKC